MSGCNEEHRTPSLGSPGNGKRGRNLPARHRVVLAGNGPGGGGGRGRRVSVGQGPGKGQ